MKILLAILFILILVLGFSLQAYATLELRGEGTSADGTYRLIYDTDFNITWYDYTRIYDTWQNQVNWAGALDVDFGGAHFTDWRLPTTVDGPYVYGYDGTTTGGYNITNSEMGHLFYTELGNKGYVATNGTNPQPGWGLTNASPFINLQPSYYWLGTEYAANTENAWDFGPNDGWQGNYDKSYNNYAMAVRPGDVSVVPEPISSLLFIAGGVILSGKVYMKRKLNLL